MKILFLVSSFYPSIGATSNCVMKIAVKMIELGHEVEVLTVDDNNLQVCDIEFNSIKINLFPHIAKVSRKKFKESSNNLFFYIYFIIVKILYKLVFKYFDEYILKKKFIRNIRKINKKFDVAISVSSDFAASLALLDFEKKFKKRVLYQVDPYSTNIIYSKKKIHSRLKKEKKVYLNFDYVFTTSLIKNELSNFFDLSDNVITLGFPCINDENYFASYNKVINFIYGGFLSKEVRNYSYAIDFLNKYNSVEYKVLFYIYGEVDSVREKLQNTSLNYQIFSPISDKQYEKIISNCNFVINIGNNMVNQIPSKIFDSISIGIPIINFVKNSNCPTIEIINKYPLGINIYEYYSIEEQLNSFNQFICDNSFKRISKKYVKELFPDYTIENVTKNILSKIK